MLIQTIVITCWIFVSLTFYLAVGLACRGLRPSPVMAATYASVRASVSGRRWWMWYVCLFLGTIVGVSLALGGGILLLRVGLPRVICGAVIASLAIAYAVIRFRPKRSATIVCALALGSLYLFAALNRPDWLIMGVGTYALCIPPLVWFRTLRIRTAACLLMAFAVYDAIHVYGTGWMLTFVHGIFGTPFVLEIPRTFELDALTYFSIGQGDILAPGLLVVIAARVADPRKAAWLVAGCLAGAAVGLALTAATTLVIHGPLPALIVIGPCSCIGYVAGLAAHRLLSAKGGKT